MKTSFFNKTAFRKNLTRFAPVWILYTLVLLAVLAVNYANQEVDYRRALFALGLMEMNDMGIINLVYALLVAQLLFGDLFNSRMCNALHALPLRRECWFVTNVVSGLAFSLVPSLVMALAALPMLAGSIVEGAWKIPFLNMISYNLQFICFFGIAVFCVMCVGNRFTMVAGYGLVNAGAAIAYWAVNTLYTPMLYGVITPSAWADNLTPLYHAMQVPYEYADRWDLYDTMRRQGCSIHELTATFTINEVWWRFWILAGVGIVLMALALLLYRKRNLECAGDAVAFPALVPVFQVFCTLFVVTAAQYLLKNFVTHLLTARVKYSVMALSLVLGWFVGRALVERSFRVFGKRNWYGLGILAAVLALSFLGTHFDILGIETRLPDLNKIESVEFWWGEVILTEEEDKEKVLRLHALALEDRVDNNANTYYSDMAYVRGYDGSMVPLNTANRDLFDIHQENPEIDRTKSIRLTYHMRDGKTMERYYTIWVSEETGDIYREIASRWENTYGGDCTLLDGTTVKEAEYAADHALYFTVGRKQNAAERQRNPREDAHSFLKAVKADCDAGNMARDYAFHKGMFRSNTPTMDWTGEETYPSLSCIDVTFGDSKDSLNVRVWPDSENSVRWLQENGYLDSYDVDPDADQDWENVMEMLADPEGYGLS